jgi:hypothetical protein
MSEESVVVLVAPLHGVTATAAELAKARSIRNKAGRRADIVIHSEAYSPKRRGLLKGLERWKQFTGPWTKPDPRGRVASWDVLMLTRKHHKTLWKHAAKWADASMPLKIAPVRWGVEWDLVIRRLDIAFIFDHPHAGIRPDPKLAWAKDRQAKYVGQANARRAAIKSALGRRLHVVAGGDLNYGASNREPWMPQSVFEQCDMKWRLEDVTWVAWSDGLELVDYEVIDREANGQDHAWLLVTLRPKPQVHEAPRP